MCRSSFSMCVLFILLLCPIQGIALEGFEIVGVGTNPATALRDGVRQIGEVFGGVEVFSESEVQNFILKADHVRTSSDFTGSKLDRFYKGLRHQDRLWYATFYFPTDFVGAVHEKARDMGTARFSVDWESISYQSRHADSFGEIRRTSYKLRLPDGYKNFVRRYITSNEAFGPISAFLIISAIVYLIWLIVRMFWFEEKVRYHSIL